MSMAEEFKRELKRRRRVLKPERHRESRDSELRHKTGGSGGAANPGS